MSPGPDRRHPVSFQRVPLAHHSLVDTHRRTRTVWAFSSLRLPKKAPCSRTERWGFVLVMLMSRGEALQAIEAPESTNLPLRLIPFAHALHAQRGSVLGARAMPLARKCKLCWIIASSDFFCQLFHLRCEFMPGGNRPSRSHYFEEKGSSPSLSRPPPRL